MGHPRRFAHIVSVAASPQGPDQAQEVCTGGKNTGAERAWRATRRERLPCGAGAEPLQVSAPLAMVGQMTREGQDDRKSPHAAAMPPAEARASNNHVVNLKPPKAAFVNSRSEIVNDACGRASMSDCCCRVRACDALHDVWRRDDVDECWPPRHYGGPRLRAPHLEVLRMPGCQVALGLHQIQSGKPAHLSAGGASRCARFDKARCTPGPLQTVGCGDAINARPRGRAPAVGSIGGRRHPRRGSAVDYSNCGKSTRSMAHSRSIDALDGGNLVHHLANRMWPTQDKRRYAADGGRQGHRGRNRPPPRRRE